MVKKLKYLLFFVPFLFTLNVNAMLLGTPNSYAYFNDDTRTGPSNAVIYGWWGSNNYYRSPYLMGGVSSSSWIKRIDFNWINANLCPSNDISITGTVGGLTDFFTEQSTSILAFNNNQQMACVTTMENSSRMKFQCYGKGGGTLSIYVFQNSYALVKQYEIGVSRDITVSCDATNLDVIQNATANTNSIINNQNSNTQDIINNQNQNNQNIINNQNSNTNTITQNQDSNTQDIINNQDGNTQDIINNQDSNTNKEIESQKVCSTINSSYIIQNKAFLNNNGAVSSTNSTEYSVTDFIDISNSTLTLLQVQTNAGGSNYCFYDVNKVKLSCSYINTPLSNIPTGTRYFRTTIRNNLPIFEICTNGNQALNDGINGLNDSITSESTPNTNQDINDMNNMVASYTPISDLITLPLTLINAYYNGINSSCSPFNLGSLLGTNLTIPCINIENHIGSSLWNTIDILCCIFLCYEIGMLFVSSFDGITSLRDDFEGLYQPRHAYTGYVAKHGGGN